MIPYEKMFIVSINKEECHRSDGIGYVFTHVKSSQDIVYNHMCTSGPNHRVSVQYPSPTHIVYIVRPFDHKVGYDTF